MGLFDIIHDIAENLGMDDEKLDKLDSFGDAAGRAYDRSRDSYNRRARSECDNIDRKIDSYAKNHPGESSKVADMRQRSADYRNKHS